MDSKKKIKIVDSIMGSGKTSWAIDMINKNKDKSYIYITPYLSEVDRIKEECKFVEFKDPKHKGVGKREDFHGLMANKKNIVATHSLFSMSNEITRNLIKYGGYTLILDEVMDVVEQLKMTKDDIRTLIDSNLITISENGIIEWNEDRLDVENRYADIKVMSINKTLVYHSDTVLIWNFPAEIFKQFKDVYVLTYYFDSQIQRYYYDLFDIEYEYYSVFGEYGYYEIKLMNNSDDCRKNDNKDKLKELIDICDHNKLNSIGDEYYALSSTWYDKNDNQDVMKMMKNNLINYFKNINNAKSNELIWTTFKKARHKIKGDGYSKGFVSCNTRATNKYKDRIYLSYCINMFLSPIIKSYFQTRGVEVNEDGYALSEMLQWIWRSGIREGKNIKIYIPSSRMRDLLNEYLK